MCREKMPRAGVQNIVVEGLPSRRIHGSGRADAPVHGTEPPARLGRTPRCLSVRTLTPFGQHPVSAFCTYTRMA
jgi:hypothetical protein